MNIARHILNIDTENGDSYCAQPKDMPSRPRPIFSHVLKKFIDETNTEFIYLLRTIDLYAMEAIAGGPPPRQWRFNDIIISAYTRSCRDDIDFYNYIDGTIRSSISDHSVSTRYSTKPVIDEVEEVVEVVIADADEEEDDDDEEDVSDDEDDDSDDEAAI